MAWYTGMQGCSPSVKWILRNSRHCLCSWCARYTLRLTESEVCTAISRLQSTLTKPHALAFRRQPWRVALNIQKQEALRTSLRRHLDFYTLKLVRLRKPLQHTSKMPNQASTFPPGKIEVAAKFSDGRYLIACSNKEGMIDHACLGYPGAMRDLKVHDYEVFRDGGTFNITISVGNLNFDFVSKELEFDWFKTEQNGDSNEINEAIKKGRLEWGYSEILEYIKITETLRSSLFG